MISIHVQGGLGNQIFMIFATMAYGIQHNIKPIFEYKYQVAERHTYWETLLDGFKIFTTAYSENDVSNDDILRFTLYYEKDFIYNPIPNFGENNTYMIGYFQSYKYFENVKNELYNIMRLEEKKNDVIQKYSKYFDANKSLISIHFRMGDYKQKRYYHPIMNYEYFESSLDYIMSNKKDSMSISTSATRVLYFCESEDNMYVESKIALLQLKYPEVEFMKVDDSIQDYDQLLIMSICNHNIISNSSYSWWGAYLNNYDSKLVCYPSKWFGEYYEHTHDHKDLMPDSWVKIQSDPIAWDKPLV